MVQPAPGSPCAAVSTSSIAVCWPQLAELARQWHAVNVDEKNVHTATDVIGGAAYDGSHFARGLLGDR